MKAAGTMKKKNSKLAEDEEAMAAEANRWAAWLPRWLAIKGLRRRWRKKPHRRSLLLR